MEPVQVVCLDDLERFAKDRISPAVWEYYHGAADNHVTFIDNREAFSRYKILPRILRNVSNRDLSTTILGHKISFPVCIGPTATHIYVHENGEIATAQGAESMNVAYCQSNFSTKSLSDVAKGAPRCLRFLNIFLTKNKKDVLTLIRQAENNGYKAIFVTVDANIIGSRRGDKRANFTAKKPEGVRLKVFEIIDKYKDKPGNEISQDFFKDPYLEFIWNDVDWLKSVTNLKIVLKGILTPEDALLAVNYGVDGIVVSNHGGRQIDTTPATIDVLQEIVQAVDGKIEVYLDGGIRTGSDVFKALALGAKAVFIGRPVLHGLKYDGSKGVELVLRMLRDELETTMTLAGCKAIKEISPRFVRHISQFPTSMKSKL